MQTLEEITTDGSQTLATMLKAAYDAGYAKGRDDVRKELDAFLVKPAVTFQTAIKEKTVQQLPPPLLTLRVMNARPLEL